MIQIFNLEHRIRDYAWGSTHWLSDLLGIPNEERRPQAELWLGAHESAPSRIRESGGSQELDAWIAAEPEARLGPEVAARFDGHLPFLLKVLAAARPLSLQAHPNADQARAGFDRENGQRLPLDARERSYRDARPKPELLCALTPFEALLGFRAPSEIAELLEPLELGELGELTSELASASEDEPAALRRFFARLMQIDASQQRYLAERASERCCALDDARAYRWVCELAATHPGDVGVLAPLMLNLVRLEPGEAIFLPAGEMHSYLHGCGVELMGNSDNVVRGGLTEKFKDVPELLEILTFRPGPPEILHPTRRSANETYYRTPAHEFELAVLDLRSGGASRHELASGAEILLCAQGELVVAPEAGGPALSLPRGSAVFVCGAPGAYEVRGEGRAFRASMPG